MSSIHHLSGIPPAEAYQPGASEIWPSANQDRPCPVCGKTNRCRIAPDGMAAVCWRSGSGDVVQCGPRHNGNATGYVGAAHRPRTTTARPPKVFATPEAAFSGCFVPGGTLVASWIYPGDFARVGRWDVPDEKKQCRPIHQTEAGWKIGDPPGLWPLYRSDEIPPEGTIYVVEGEKCADCGWSIGLPGVTSAHGSSSAAKSDWSPLAGRDVVILPDNDDAGRLYADAVVKILALLGCRTKIVQLPGLSEGEDIADYAAVRGDERPHDIAAGIVAIAEGVPWTPETEQAAKPAAVSHKLPDSGPANDADFPLTDAGNGERLMHRHGDKLRFVARWNKPIIFAGTHWQIDEGGEAERLQIETSRNLKQRAVELSNGDAKAEYAKKLFSHAVSCEARRRIADALAMAAKVEGASVQPDAIDADKWLLNAANGTIDLRTGRLMPHRRQDLITKVLPVGYDAALDCPTFITFLARIFEGNDRLITFVQRMIGYSLTGITTERAVFILYGSGCNGKSTLLGAVRDLLAAYAMQVPPSSLMAKRHGDGIPNDIARLKGARFVSASESDEGQRINESLIKQMSGGEDVLTARFMRGEFFDFKPEFKIFLATNHRPEIRGTDAAIWDRIKLIPFNVRINEAEKDTALPGKLRAELGGILAWAVRGCLEWQRDGLGVPTEVQDAVDEYRHDMDRIGDFIAERCVVGDAIESSASTLYNNYKIWCSLSGEDAANQTKFGRTLDERGYASGRDSATRRKTRKGIGVLSEDGESDFRNSSSPF